jgi:UDP-N-acetyl-D-mannosaminuronic acid dehydrogenase
MAKLVENSFRDVNIAFANELSVICAELGIDVWELIGLANRHPRVNILNPGPGVGGHCIAVDPWFIVSRSPEAARLIRTARETNDAKPRWVLDRVDRAVAGFLAAHPGRHPSDVAVACWGLAFKPDIDDLRESPALGIARELCDRYQGPVLAVEPHVAALPPSLARASLADLETALAKADLHVVLVAHQAFRDLPARLAAARVPAARVVDAVGLTRAPASVSASVPPSVPASAPLRPRRA